MAYVVIGHENAVLYNGTLAYLYSAEKYAVFNSAFDKAAVGYE